MSLTLYVKSAAFPPPPPPLQDERARKYAQEVQSLQFNVLVTTYEFIMRDRARLSKVGGFVCVRGGVWVGGWVGRLLQ